MQMSDNIHHKCREIMAELGKAGEFEFWGEFEWLPKQKLEKRLKDILENDVDEKYYLSDTYIKEVNKSNVKCVLSGGMWDKINESARRVYDIDKWSPTLHCAGGGNTEPKIKVPSATKKGYEVATTGDSINLTHPRSTTRRGRVGKQVSQTLDCACNQAIVEPQLKQVGTYKKEIVKRTNETPKEINEYLKENKNGYTLKQISELSGIKKTTIEHYFRTDKSRAIPSKEDWFKLKNILKLDDRFDSVITETENKISTFESTSRVYNDEVAPTLTCGDSSLHSIDYRIRKLTPRECFRLQDFPDSFLDNLKYGTDEQLISNSQLYRQAGNSISVNVMEMIFRQIEKSRDNNLLGGLFS
jgi:DNA (cytosine-5)-methyltransferase 1